MLSMLNDLGNNLPKETKRESNGYLLDVRLVENEIPLSSVRSSPHEPIESLEECQSFCELLSEQDVNWQSSNQDGSDLLFEFRANEPRLKRMLSMVKISQIDDVYGIKSHLLSELREVLMKGLSHGIETIPTDFKIYRSYGSVDANIEGAYFVQHPYFVAPCQTSGGTRWTVAEQFHNDGQFWQESIGDTWSFDSQEEAETALREFLDSTQHDLAESQDEYNSPKLQKKEAGLKRTDATRTQHSFPRKYLLAIILLVICLSVYSQVFF